MSTAAIQGWDRSQVIHRIPREPLSTKALFRILALVVGIVSAILTLRMKNTAFIDEALYINAGHAYIDHWLHGTPLGDAGTYFSGAPTLYPVLAAVIDSAGGLLLVRAFSLVCVMAAALALQATARSLWGYRAGLLTLTIFLLTGPVIFLSGFATFDALVVLFLSTALWLGIAHRSLKTAALIGLILPLMVAVKYTSFIFVPVVLAAMVVANRRRPIVRTAIATLVALGVLALSWLRWGDAIAESLAFTTTERKALSPTTIPVLLGYTWSYVGFLIVLGLIGAIVICFDGKRWILFAVGMFGAAALLPVAQMRLHEEVSFQKHLAYSAVFLSLLAGVGLARISRLPLMIPPVLLLCMLFSMVGWARSDVMYNWINVAPVVVAIEQQPTPGLYLSSATDSLKYHTKALPGVTWETSFVLYSTGPEGIKRAVADRKFQTVILRTASTGSPEQDASQKILLEALQASPSYDLAYEPFKVARYGDDRWLIYSLVPRVEPELPENQFPSDSRKK